MKPSQANGLGVGTPVWIWIVRVGNGAWWPGVVERVATGETVNITVRFECHSNTKQKGSCVFIGVTTTKPRYLELRDINAAAADRPSSVPVPLLRRPEVA